MSERGGSGYHNLRPRENRRSYSSYRGGYSSRNNSYDRRSFNYHDDDTTRSGTTEEEYRRNSSADTSNRPYHGGYYNGGRGGSGGGGYRGGGYRGGYQSEYRGGRGGSGGYRYGRGGYRGYYRDDDYGSYEHEDHEQNNTGREYERRDGNGNVVMVEEEYHEGRRHTHNGSINNNNNINIHDEKNGNHTEVVENEVVKETHQISSSNQRQSPKIHTGIVHEKENPNIMLLGIDKLTAVDVQFKENLRQILKREIKIDDEIVLLHKEIYEKSLEIEELNRQMVKSRLQVELTEESLQSISLL